MALTLKFDNVTSRTHTPSVNTFSGDAEEGAVKPPCFDSWLVLHVVNLPSETARKGGLLKSVDSRGLADCEDRTCQYRVQSYRGNSPLCGARVGCVMWWRSKRVWRWVNQFAEVYFEGLPRKAFITSLTNCLKEYPQLNGRESAIVHRIEEQCRSGVQRHASMAVDNRASTHLQIACLVQGTYQTLLPWFRNDQEKVIDIIRKPVGESSAAAVGVAQRVALLLSFDKFRLVSQGLKYMEADFGKAFLVAHHERPNFHRARVSRCLYHSVFTAEGNPELTPIFCALDSMWFDQLKAQKHGVQFQRPTTLARGDAACDFELRRTVPGRSSVAQRR